MTTREHRKYIPVKVKLEACLIALGFTPEQIKRRQIRWDHIPALGLRPVNDDGKMYPHPNDPRYIQPLLVEDHDVKTFGRATTTAGSDIANIAKAKRLAADRKEFCDRLLAKTEPVDTPPPRSKWPSRPFPSRRKEQR